MVADLRAESDELDALVAPLSSERWADPTPAPGWTIAHQIAHLLWTDRVALTAVTDEAAFAEVLAEAAADPGGLRRQGRRGTGGSGAGRVARRLAGHPGTAARRAADGARRSQAAVVRPSDECCLDGHRAVDGDLGARTRRRRCPGRDRPATERLRSIAHLGVRTRDIAFFINNLAPPDRAVPGRAARARRRHRGPGGRPMRTSGSAGLRRTSASWSRSGVR